MALRTWIATVIVVAGLFAALAAASYSHTVTLRSEHAKPASRVPAQVVAVTPTGNTFHDPNCPYIHGPIETMPAAKAVRKGYTPCTRCMREAMGE
jgi:hypothetical protein